MYKDQCACMGFWPVLCRYRDQTVGGALADGKLATNHHYFCLWIIKQRVWLDA